MIHLVIPMSGLGKRFVEAGYDTPKPLIVVDGKPIIQHIVELFPVVDKVSFICNEKHLKETDMRKILMDIVPECNIYEISVGNLGPVDAVCKMSNEIGDDEEVIVSYCDYGTVWDFDKFLKEVREKELDGAIPSYIGFHPHMLGSDNYAFCKLGENGLLEQIKEKEPFTDDKMNEYASNGTYYFRRGEFVKKYFKELMDRKIDLNGEYYVSLVYNLLVEDSLRVSVFEIEKMLQWGTPYDLEVYNGWSRHFNRKSSVIASHEDDCTLILPMAGRGSRFESEGYDTPKPFIDVDGKPMIIQAVDCLPETKQKVFITLKNHNEKYDINKLLTSTYDNVDVVEIDETTDGQASTCLIGMDRMKVDLDKPILISACDNGVYYNPDKYMELVNDEDVDIIVWTFRNNQTSKVNPNAYAWLDVDENDYVRSVSCKKFPGGNPLTTHAIIGTMYFRKGEYFIEGLYENYRDGIRTNGEFYVDDVLNQNINDGLRVKVFEADSYICWGTPNDYKTYSYWKEYFEIT